MGEKALILSADHWEMADEKTGELRRGVSVWYVNEYREDDGKSIGNKPTKISADVKVLEELRAAKLPNLFELQFASRPGAQGKATLTLIGLKKIADVDVFNPPTKKAA